MAWIDGLDIPFSYQNDVGFFEFGSERVTDYATPNFSRSERLWCHPGLRPLSGLQDTVSSPIGAYRWEFTDRALTEQLLLEDEGQPATVEQGHAAVRYVNPTTGGDVMPTIRAEFHRVRSGTATPRGARSAPACSRYSTAKVRWSSAVASMSSISGTCSSCRVGLLGRFRQKRSLICSAFRMPRSSSVSISIGWTRKEAR